MFSVVLSIYGLLFVHTHNFFHPTRFFFFLLTKSKQQKWQVYFRMPIFNNRLKSISQSFPLRNENHILLLILTHVVVNCSPPPLLLTTITIYVKIYYPYQFLSDIIGIHTLHELIPLMLALHFHNKFDLVHTSVVHQELWSYLLSSARSWVYDTQWYLDWKYNTW